MRMIRMNCSRCNASLTFRQYGELTTVVCPYCGNDVRLLVESDRVRIARLQADTARAELALEYSKHRDEVAAQRSLLRIRTVIICVVALVVLILLGFYLGWW